MRNETRAEAARQQMIARLLRRDGRENIPPEINHSLDLDYFLTIKRKEGLLCLCDDSAAVEALQAAAWKVWAAFGERIARKNFTGLFLFDAGEQRGEWAACDGMAVRYSTTNGTLAYKIGVSSQAVSNGEQELLQVLLHEVCHVLNWTAYGHEAEWHAAFGQMLAEFNHATGMTLENDGWDFNGEGGWRTPPEQPWL